MEKSEKDAKQLSNGAEWNYRAKVVNGALTLYWLDDGKEVYITLEKDETANLLDLLYNNRHEILSHTEEF